MNRGDTFLRLTGAMDSLREAHEALVLTLVEDRPAANDVALADCLGDAASEALGCATHAQDAARRAASAIAEGETGGAREALAESHAEVCRLLRLRAEALASFERMDDLACLGPQRGRQWAGWASAVRRALRHSAQQEIAALEAAAACWQSLATPPEVDRHAPSASVFVTN